MICDVVTPDGEPYEGDPRHVLRRALERMQSLGFDTFNVGPELEYFLFRDKLGTETLDEGGYFAMTALDAATELRNETIRALEEMGIGSSITITRSRPRSTRSTCATRARSTWPTRPSPTG